MLPSFTCTYDEILTATIQIDAAGSGASGFLNISCVAGRSPEMSGVACAGPAGPCNSNMISASAGDTIKIAASMNSTATQANLTDVSNGQSSSASAPGVPSNAGLNAWFGLQGSNLIPSFSKITFSGALVNGLPLVAHAHSSFNMVSSGKTQITTGPLASSGQRFAMTFSSSGPNSALCPKREPQRSGNPSAQSGYGFSGVYRLGDSGKTVAPTTGPSTGPGPFHALGGVYAKLLNCSPWVTPGSYVSAWIMLQQFGDGNDHIQIGWEEFAGGHRETLVELQDPADANENPSKPFENCDDRSTWHELWCAKSPIPAAPIGTWTYYTIEYHPELNQFLLYTQQAGESRVLVARVSSVKFKPNMADLEGETHSTYDQMPGTASAPEVFEDAKVYNADGHGWENFYGGDLYNGDSVSHLNTTFPGSQDWYGDYAYLPASGPNAGSGQVLLITDNGS